MVYANYIIIYIWQQYLFSNLTFKIKFILRITLHGTPDATTSAAAKANTKWYLPISLKYLLDSFALSTNSVEDVFNNTDKGMNQPLQRPAQSPQ